MTSATTAPVAAATMTTMVGIVSGGAPHATMQ
jgi:hypothetical protein